MTNTKTSLDIVQNLQKIINPVMLLTAHYDLLTMFIEECDFEGAIIEQRTDLLDDYYSLYNESTDEQKPEIIGAMIEDGINPRYLSEFFIYYDSDIEVMKHQTKHENIQYMQSLFKEVADPTELINCVREYILEL